MRKAALRLSSFGPLLDMRSLFKVHSLHGDVAMYIPNHSLFQFSE